MQNHSLIRYFLEIFAFKRWKIFSNIVKTNMRERELKDTLESTANLLIIQRHANIWDFKFCSRSRSYKFYIHYVENVELIFIGFNLLSQWKQMFSSKGVWFLEILLFFGVILLFFNIYFLSSEGFKRLLMCFIEIEMNFV